MMKTIDFVGTNVRIRVFENNLLKNDQFERMLQAPNFEEALSVLKDTPYRNDIEELNHTKNYDAFLVKELQRMYAELFAISPEPALIELFSLRYIYHNLKVLIKEQETGNDFKDLLIPIGRFSISTLKHAVETGKSDELGQFYLDSIKEVKTDYEEYHKIQSVDIILDRRYFTHLKEIAVQLNDQKIIEFVDYYIDLNNLSTLVRTIKQKRTRNFMTTVLSSAGSVSKEEWITLGAESSDLEMVGKKMLDSKYKTIIQKSIDPKTKELSPVLIDLETDNAIMERMKDAKFDSFGPMPIISYIYAKENEVKNLRLVLAGKENNLPTEDIEERMRINYGS